MQSGTESWQIKRKQRIGIMAEAAVILDLKGKLKKSIQYSTTQCRVPELIAVLGSQPAGNMSHIINPVVGCHYFLPGPQLPS